MIENRELTFDDYLAMLRRRLMVILIPTLLAPLAGFAVSFAFQPKYTSQSLVLVEEQKVPEGYVRGVVSEDLSQRITTLQQRALSAEKLRPLIEKLNLAHGPGVEGVIEQIRNGVTIQPVQAAVVPAPGAKRGNVPGFYVNYTGNNPHDTQSICSELTNMMIRENFEDRATAAKETTEFLTRQLQDQKRTLDELDSRLAAFKKQYIGQLPGDEENNLKILMAMNSQLDANTQTLNRAQQDKAYAESMLAQQLAAWKSSSESNSNPQTLQKQLADLQAQLVTLRSRYTDDYPEVIKTKRDIQELQKKVDEVNTAAQSQPVSDSKANVVEPPEIQQLRNQVHQYQQIIAQATRDQQRLQDQIRLYQGRVALSPTVEEQYKQLTRDYETAMKVYNDLLAKKSESEMQTAMERDQQGEQMNILRPADLPDSPSFPNRWLFAGGGLGAGLALGFGLALWMEFRDKLVRTEEDVLAVLELPVLSQVPWVGAEADSSNLNGDRKSAAKRARERKETVEV